MKLIILACVLVFVNAELPFFSSAIGDNMVLQRAPASAAIWGWYKPGESISCAFDGRDYVTKVSSSGKWLVRFAPHAAGGPYDIKCKCLTSGETHTLTNVLFGDVLLCGGQSNMQMGVSGSLNGAEEVKRAANYTSIRLFTTGQLYTGSNTTVDNFAAVVQPWQVASSATVGGYVWTYFSATCWYTAVRIYDQYKVPLGLMSSNYGGTYITAWIDEENNKKCADYNAYVYPPNAASYLYNSMIYPLRDMQFKAVLWYQGESDLTVGFHKNGPEYYKCAFPVMVNAWRQTLQQPDLPFVFVQLAAYIQTLEHGDTELAKIRLSQESVLTLPHTCMATAVDLGDFESDLGNIHPRNKSEVGRRLSLCVRSTVYGEKVLAVAPKAVDARTYKMNTLVVVNFNGNIRLLDVPKCPTGDATDCANFLYMNKAGEWKAVDFAQIASDNQLLITCSEDAYKISYGMSAWPLTNLYGTVNNLPVTPFVIDVTRLY